MILTNKHSVYEIKDAHDARTEVKSTSEVAGTASMTSQRSVRKYVIICVTCLAIATLLVIGALVAVKLITDTQRDIFNYERHIVAGNVTIDDSTFRYSPDNNSLLHSYHVKDPSGESWGITDYSRRTMLAKFDTDPGVFVCLLYLKGPDVDTALLYDDSSDKPVPLQVTNTTFTFQPVNFNVSSEPLKNVSSILGSSERTLCANVDVFLADAVIATTSTTTVAPAGNFRGSETWRRRRATRGRRYLKCVVDRSRCGFYRIVGDPVRLYWSCPRTCTQISR